MIPWIIISILVLLIIFAIIAVIFAKKGKKRPTDYYTFFIIGVTWFPFGILMSLMDSDGTFWNIFTILGLTYMIMGLVHKKEWKKNHVPFNKLPDSRRKLSIIISLVLGLLILLMLVFLFYR